MIDLDFAGVRATDIAGYTVLHFQFGSSSWAMEIRATNNNVFVYYILVRFLAVYIIISVTGYKPKFRALSFVPLPCTII